MLHMLWLATNIYAADIQPPPQIPARFTCPIIRALYKRYSKNYSQEEMEAYLRSHHISQENIEKAKRCLA